MGRVRLQDILHQRLVLAGLFHCRCKFGLLLLMPVCEHTHPASDGDTRTVNMFWFCLRFPWLVWLPTCWATLNWAPSNPSELSGRWGLSARCQDLRAWGYVGHGRNCLCKAVTDVHGEVSTPSHKQHVKYDHMVKLWGCRRPFKPSV